MSVSPRLALQFLAAGQAQKETTVNESLQTLDLLVAGAVEQGALADPPVVPLPGTCFIVAEGATGAWAGKSQSVAGYTDGGWRFIAPVEGMTVYIKDISEFACYRSGSWETGVVRGASLVLDGQRVVGSRGAAVAAPTGGAIVDGEARATIGNILSALRQHGLIES